MRHRRHLAGALAGMLVLSFAAATRAAAPPSTAEAPPAAAPEPTEPSGAVGAVAPVGPDATVYGAGARLRWVSVPHWLLGLFTKQNQSLSSYGFALEGFRRRGDMDIVLGLSYQRMGPPDGNWLGKGHAANIDTDLVQFRNFGFVGLDASFIWRTVMNEHVAFRYGAGLGLAIMTGKMLRTSAAFCTEQNAGDTHQCRPHFCPATGCTEALLAASEGPVDNGPGQEHRFVDGNVPGAIPIINLVTGVDFHIPNVKGLELRLEGGFYNAFFLGMAVGYLF